MRISSWVWSISVCLVGAVPILGTAQDGTGLETNRIRPPTRLFTNANGEIGIIYGTQPAAGANTGRLAAPPPATRLFTNANGEIGVFLGQPTPTAVAPLPNRSTGRVFTNANGEVGSIWQRPEHVPARHGPGQFFTNVNGEVGVIWDTPTRWRPAWVTNPLTGAIFPSPAQIPWTALPGQSSNVPPPPPGHPVPPGNHSVPPGNPILPGNNAVPPGNPVPPGNNVVPPGPPIPPGGVPPPQPNIPPPSPKPPAPKPAPPAPGPAK